MTATNGTITFEKRNGVPQCTLENFDKDFAERHLLHGLVEKWATETPDNLAFINADTGDQVSWARLDQTSTALALMLLDMGFEKGDYFATSLPLLSEHIFLEYACFKIGVVFVPLDLRLKGPEVIRSLGLVQAKGFAFLGKIPAADFRELGKAVMANCPFVEHFIQFSAPEETIEGATNAFVLAAQAKALAEKTLAEGPSAPLLQKFMATKASIDENDGCLVIFTTGSTGYPKPALLNHRAITCQNMCLGAAFGIMEGARMLVNLPPSHVGCQTEQLMTVFFYGGTAVILHIFDAEKSLKAIQDHNVDSFGQIPALFNLQWRLPNYKDYDLSSLKFALYGGQQVSRQFLENLSSMAPSFGTGLGLTETAGFCTYSPLDGTVDDILAGVGYDMPVYPISIRAPMKADGSAGDEMPAGANGAICFSGPQTFMYYVNAPEATAKTISSDGFIYIAVGSDAQWRRFVEQEVFASLDEPRFATNEGRRADKVELHRRVGEITARHATDAVAAAMARAGVPHSRITAVDEVMDLEFVAKTHLRTTAPDGRQIRLPPPAVPTAHLEALGGELPFAPAYGENTDAVLSEVGLGEDEIEDLRLQGVVA